MADESKLDDLTRKLTELIGQCLRLHPSTKKYGKKRNGSLEKVNQITRRFKNLQKERTSKL
jgi:hypothetical protein